MSTLLTSHDLPLDLTPKIIQLNDQYCDVGSFGDVYKCRYWVDLTANSKEVAVKALHFYIPLEDEENQNDRLIRIVREELGIWRRLDHRNIVPFLGTATGFGRLGSVSLVSLWMPNGTLQNLLLKYDDELTTAHRLRLLLDIANGLLCLHSCSILHGNLNSNNVLIDEGFCARLTGFGYAAIVREIPDASVYLEMSRRRPGAIRWAAPEQVDEGADEALPMTRSDIYSFGSLALQVLSGKSPWSEVRKDTTVLHLLSKGQNPGRPKACPIDDQHWEFIQQCWSQIENRPSANDVVQTLHGFTVPHSSHPSLCDLFQSSRILSQSREPHEDKTSTSPDPSLMWQQQGAGAPPRPLTVPGGPGGPPIPASLPLAPHPSRSHQSPPASQQAPIPPMPWGYYYPVNANGSTPWFPHPSMPTFPPNLTPHSIPTIIHTVPHPPHTPQRPAPDSYQLSSSISVSSPPPTPSTATAPGSRSLNTNASTFVPTAQTPNVITIKNRDGQKVNLETLKEHSPRPPTASIPPPSTSRWTTSVGIESEESKRKEKEQEKKEAEERAKKQEEETKPKEREKQSKKKRQKEERLRKEQEEKERLRLEEEERKRKEEHTRLEQGHKAREEGERAVRDADAQRLKEAFEREEDEDTVEGIDPSPLLLPSEPLGRPDTLDIHTAKDGPVSPQSALMTARHITSFDEVMYPEGIKAPKVGLNRNVKDGRFRYDRDFLMQFMMICKEKPPMLPPLDVLGIEPRDQSIVMSRGRSGRHRQASGATPASATRQTSVGLGIGFGGEPGPQPSPFSMGQFATPGNKLTSEERCILSSGTRSASVGGPTSLQFGRPPMTCTTSQSGPGEHPMGSNRTRSKRGEKHSEANKVTFVQQGQASAFGGAGAAAPLGAPLEPVTPLEMSANPTCNAAMDVDSPEMVDRRVKALLDELTIDNFNFISDQIIAWANKSVNEKDGQTLARVTGHIFEKAISEDSRSEMYARLCRKTMETISPEIEDDSIKNVKGGSISGGQLFRKYLLTRCQGGWSTKEATAAEKASDDRAFRASETKEEENELCTKEYFAVPKGRHQGLGLIKFIGELFKVQILTERIIHECVNKLLANIQNPEDEKIESLCQLLKTVGHLLDVPKARARMDVYFIQMTELSRSHDLSPRMQSTLQDVIALRERKWVACNTVNAPITAAALSQNSDPMLGTVAESGPSSQEAGLDPGQTTFEITRRKKL